MFLRISRTRDGVRYAHLVEGYRDGRGKSRQRVVEACGRVDRLEAADPDAITKLRARAAALTAERAARRVSLEVDTSLPADGVMPLNVGWLLVDAVLDRLGVAAAVRREARRGGWSPEVADVVTGLVAARVVWPGSKRAAVEKADRLFGGPHLDLGRVYHGLDRIAEVSVTVQTTAATQVGRTPDILATVDYDVTNYFFHIDTDDPDLVGKTAGRGQAGRHKGPSKEHRLDPIIQMGLFCDTAGIPVSYRLFDGNVPDMVTLPTAVAEFKHQFHPGRVVVVGDKAMNTRTNMGTLAQAGDGWIVSESVRNAASPVHAWVLDPTGWTWNDTHTAGHKSLLVHRGVPVTTRTLTNVVVDTDEKLVVTWCADRAARDARIRGDLVSRAEVLAGDESRYRAGLKKGARKYVTAETINPATGEISPMIDTHLRLDQARIDTDARWDGYTMIRTSETTTADLDLIGRYHQLVQIEDAFRITKTTLQARPVYVWTRPHIEAHFLICFLALLVTRLLHTWTGLPVPQLVDALRRFDAIPVGKDLHRLCRPTGWDHIDQVTGVPLNHTWATLTDLRTWHRHLKTTLKTTTLTPHADTNL